MMACVERIFKEIPPRMFLAFIVSNLWKIVKLDRQEGTPQNPQILWKAALSAQVAAISKLGNCKMYATTYIGAGTCGSSNPCHAYFTQVPSIVFILGPDRMLIFFSFAAGWGFGGNSLYTVTGAYTGYNLSWYTDTVVGQLNQSGITYRIDASVTVIVENKNAALGQRFSVSKKCFRPAEASFQNFEKFRKLLI
jgi:hypothetical protein